jgi:hypothetical protein
LAIQAIDQKWGNCQINWTPKIINDSYEITLVDADHPIKGGKAPGKAPIKTEKGLSLFNGVYMKV